MTDNQNTSESTTKQARNAFRFSLVATIIMAAIVVIMLFTIGMPNGLLDLTTWAIIVTITGVVSLWLTQRGQYVIGSLILIGSFVLACIVASLTLSGMAPMLAIVILIIAFGIGSATLPHKLANIVTAFGVGLALGVILLDVFEPFERTPTGYSNLTWIFTGVLALVFGYSIFRNFGQYNFRTKLIISFILIAVISVGTLSTFTQSTTTNLIKENLGRELQTVAETQGANIGDILDEQINSIKVLSINDVIQKGIQDQIIAYSNNAATIQTEIEELDQIWKTADAANNNQSPLVSEHLNNSTAQELQKFQDAFAKHAEVFVTDRYGALVGASNRTSDYNQADEEWWQAAYNDGMGAIYISKPVFDESVGQMSVLLAIPIINEATAEVIGVIRTTYLLDTLVSILGKPIGETGEAELYIPAEFEIDYPFYLDQGEYKPVEVNIYEQIIDTADHTYLEMFYKGADSIVSQASVVSTAGNPAINDLGWFVVVHQASADVFAPIQAQTRASLGLVILIAIVATAAAVGLAQVLVAPITRLTNTAQDVSAGNLSARAEVTTQDEIGTLAVVFNEMAARLQDTLSAMEQRINARTRDLELAAEVGRRLSLVRTTDIMLTEAVEIIRERFDLYYTQVYLTDPTGRALVLRAGTGNVGHTLLNRGHRLPVDMGSLNGIAASERRAVIVEDTETSPLHRANPLLPDTRSEMVIPLLVGERVVGVLDMQSAQPGALSGENLAAFETLAGQLAIAIANASLFEEAEQARHTVEEQTQRLTQTGWHDFMDAIERSERLAYTFDRENITPLPEPLSETHDETTLVTPIRVSGTSVGKLQFTREAAWTEDDFAVSNAVAQQVAQQIENLRLLAQSEQYQAEAQQALQRLTREGWEGYQDQFELGQGFVYQEHEVQSLTESSDSFEDALRYELKVRDATIGVLSIAGAEALSKDDAELVAAVNEQLSAHLENLRLSTQTEQALAQTEKQAQHLAALNDLSEQLAQVQTIDDVYKISTPILNQIITADRTSMSRFTTDGKSLELFALQGEAGAMPTGTQLPLEGTVLGKSISERRVLIIPDVGSSPYKDGQAMANQGLNSALVVPLIVGGQAIGTLNFGSTEPDAYDERESDLATQAASLMTNTIENRDLLAQTQRRAKREQDLRQIATRVRTFVESDMILQTAVRELGNALGRKVVVNLGSPAANAASVDEAAPSDESNSKVQE